MNYILERFKFLFVFFLCLIYLCLMVLSAYMFNVIYENINMELVLCF